MEFGDCVRRPWRLTFHFLILLATTGLAGCGNDPSEVAKKPDRALRSWSETVRMAAEQWVQRRVPDLYFRQVLEAAGEGLDEQAKSLSKMPSGDPRRQDLDHRLDALRGEFARLTEALGHSDRDKAHSVAGTLADRSAADAPDGGNPS
jgi:hypothetical protein